jgi:hypothetical protein
VPEVEVAHLCGVHVCVLRTSLWYDEPLSSYDYIRYEPHVKQELHWTEMEFTRQILFWNH